MAVVSPSWGGPSAFPGVFDLGVRNLSRLLGVTIREFPTARMGAEELYRNPQARAEDINAAFADPEVSGVFASIGGDDSVRILPYLDLPTILANPKVLMGFSDSTTLTAYLAQHGLVTFNGPSVMAGFAQMDHLPDRFGADVRRLLCEPEETFDYEPFGSWCDGYSDWNATHYRGETLPLQPHDGWRWLQGNGVVEGRLFGGCIEVLEFMKGTPFWPSLDFWHGRILFFETSEDKPTVNQVVWMLRNYGSMGALDQVAGMLFGRARSYSNAEKEALYEAVVRVIGFEFGRPDLPVVANLDFGHTDPQWVLPLGARFEIDCERRSLRLREAAVT